MEKIKMNQEEKALQGKLFQASDENLKKLKFKTHRLNQIYNKTKESNQKKRSKILKKMLKSIGKNAAIVGPIYFHYGIHTTIGDNFVASFNLTLQDDTYITIGNNCFVGPNVTIVTPVHPLLPNERNQMLDRDNNKQVLCYAKPVTIGDNCWLCANVTILSDVNIGNNCVIGAGSVVTKDIPDNCFAAGNPCRVIKTISEKDSMIYKQDILDGCNVIR